MTRAGQRVAQESVDAILCLTARQLQIALQRDFPSHPLINIDWCTNKKTEIFQSSTYVRNGQENSRGTSPSRCCGASPSFLNSHAAQQQRRTRQAVESSVLLTTHMISRPKAIRPCVLRSTCTDAMPTIKVTMPARLWSRMEVSGQSQISRNHQGGHQSFHKGQHL